MEWRPGCNMPALTRGGVQTSADRTLNAIGMQLVGNIISNLERIPHGLLHKLACALGDREVRSHVQTDAVTALLCAVSRSTVRSWRARAFSARHHPRHQPMAMSTPNGQIESQAAPCPASADGDANLGIYAVEQMPLPDVETNAQPPQDCQEDKADVSDTDVFEDSVDDEISVCNRLNKWQQHPTYLIGIRMAELCTMWYVNGWAQVAFAPFLAWAKHRLPEGVFGDLNHSGKFVHEFLPSLVSATQTCLAGTLHSMIPALGLPSLLSRVIDVVSVNGQSLLPVIHIYTNSDGILSWALLGCPALEASVNSAEAANGTPMSENAAENATVFGFHKAPRMVYTVHELENKYHIFRDDRNARVVVTCADQAIQGPGSIHFTKEECRVDGKTPDLLSEAICKFHTADGVGGAVDRWFKETELYDRMLRLQRRHFGFGTGKLILRACANRFDDMAREFESQAKVYCNQVASLEAKGQVLAAERARRNAAKADAEAIALRRSGWTKASMPQAPKADGTRKVVWMTKSREQLFKQFGVTYWAIQARMAQCLETSRKACEKQGRPVTADTGWRTQEMKSWRSLGRAMCDIRILVFNLGRADFRRKYLRAYALEVQASLTASSMESAINISEGMMTAVGVLVEMRGILKFIQGLFSGYELVCKNKRWVITNESRLLNPHSVIPKAYSLWLTCKTLLTRKCWRTFPNLALKLTEIVLGGSFCGVPLQGTASREPPPRGCPPPAVGGSIEDVRARTRARRDERFRCVLDAIDRLLTWTKLERHEFMVKLLGVPPRPPRKAPITQCPDLPHVPDMLDDEDDEDEDDGRAADKDDEDGGQAHDDVDGGRVQCSFRPVPCPPPPAADGASGDKSATNAYLADLLSEKIDAPSKTMHEAAVFLAEACEKMAQSDRSVSLTQSDLLELTQNVAQGASVSVEEEDEESDIDDIEHPEESAHVTPSNREHDIQASSSVAGKESFCLDGLTLEEFRKLPRHTWIIGKNISKQTWTFVQEAKYNKVGRQRLRSKVNDRTRFLLQGDALFGSSLVHGCGNEEYIKSCLAAMREACAGRFWQLPRNEQTLWHKAMPRQQPPREIHDHISLEALALQYARLRAWMQEVSQTQGWHEFYEVQSITLQKKGAPSKAPCFECSLKDVREASQWPRRYVPGIGTCVRSYTHGLCIIVEVNRSPDMTRFYQHVMSSSLQEIRCRGVWHAVFAWHFYMHASTSSESLAETVGSFLQSIRCHNVSRNTSTKRIVWASQLKAAGLKGIGGEDGIMAMALNVHFDCNGPEGWHFTYKQHAPIRKTNLIQMRNEARLHKLPPWIASHLVDVVVKRQMILCKLMPRVDRFLMSKTDCEENLSAQQKRQRKDANADNLWEPKQLSAKLWQQLGITTHSLSRNIRPGAKPR